MSREGRMRKKERQTDRLGPPAYVLLLRPFVYPRSIKTEVEKNSIHCKAECGAGGGRLDPAGNLRLPQSSAVRKEETESAADSDERSYSAFGKIAKQIGWAARA